MKEAAALQQACVAYGDGRGVAELSATVRRGTAVALIGPSGAGKSTVLDLVAGTLAPSSGTVTTLGEPVAQLRGGAYRAARARIGILPQGDSLTPGLSVLQNVLAGKLAHWSTAWALWSRIRPAAADVDAAREALEAVELADRLHAWPDELSGGERKRVALARLLLQSPALWLADEPTAGLDPRRRRASLDLLLRLARRDDATVLVALHDLELLEADFDEVWALRAGRLAWRRPPRDVDADTLAALYEAAR
ncbi:MAG: ATP-binding cassette domain-containing protein [Myxococcota bacterium]